MRHAADRSGEGAGGPSPDLTGLLLRLVRRTVIIGFVWPAMYVLVALFVAIAQTALLACVDGPAVAQADVFLRHPGVLLCVQGGIACVSWKLTRACLA